MFVSTLDVAFPLLTFRQIILRNKHERVTTQPLILRIRGETITLVERSRIFCKLGLHSYQFAVTETW